MLLPAQFWINGGDVTQQCVFALVVLYNEQFVHVNWAFFMLQRGILGQKLTLNRQFTVSLWPTCVNRCVHIDWGCYWMDVQPQHSNSLFLYFVIFLAVVSHISMVFAYSRFPVDLPDGARCGCWDLWKIMQSLFKHTHTQVLSLVRRLFIDLPKP